MDAFAEVSALCSDHLKTGMYPAYLLDLREMSNILKEEGLRMDELKVLVLEFFFRLNCAETTPVIDPDLVRKVADAAEAVGLTKYDLDELFLDTIRDDSVPRRLLSARDGLYLLELCLAGEMENAELIVRSIQAECARL